MSVECSFSFMFRVTPKTARSRFPLWLFRMNFSPLLFAPPSILLAPFLLFLTVILQHVVESATVYLSRFLSQIFLLRYEGVSPFSPFLWFLLIPPPASLVMLTSKLPLSGCVLSTTFTMCRLPSFFFPPFPL